MFYDWLAFHICDGLRFIETIPRTVKLQITQFEFVRSSKSCFEGLLGDLRLLTDQHYPP